MVKKKRQRIKKKYKIGLIIILIIIACLVPIYITKNTKPKEPTIQDETKITLEEQK